MLEELKVRRRDQVGTIGCRKLRKQGYIPAVLYHKGDTSIPVAIEEREFLRVIRAHGESALVKLVFDQDKASEQQAIYKSIQTDTFKQRILHVDLLGVREGEKVSMVVPLRLTGSPVGVTEQGGILMHQLNEVSIRCEPKHIVEHIDVDISGLRLHDAITAADIEFPEGIELHHTEPSSVIATVLEPKKTVVEGAAGEEEGEGTEEGTEAAESQSEA